MVNHALHPTCITRAAFVTSTILPEEEEMVGREEDRAGDSDALLMDHLLGGIAVDEVDAFRGRAEDGGPPPPYTAESMW